MFSPALGHAALTNLRSEYLRRSFYEAYFFLARQTSTCLTELVSNKDLFNFSGALYFRSGKMRIAIEGCTHGELEKTYETIKEIEAKDGRKVSLSF